MDVIKEANEEVRKTKSSGDDVLSIGFLVSGFEIIESSREKG
jgi:hypothetical protein